MGELTIGIEGVRYIYYTGENGCITNGPNCHQCMNEVFRSDGLQDVDHVFAVAQGGLVPFFIRSLVFLYGMDTPFSLKDIWEPYLATECVQCSKRRHLPVTGSELSQEISETDKQINTVVESLFKLVPTSVEPTCPEESGSTEIAPTTTSSEMKRIISSDDAEISSKRLKIEREEEFEPAMTLCWGNIPHDQVQNIPDPPTLSEETEITESKMNGIESASEQNARGTGAVRVKEGEIGTIQPVVSANVKEEPREVEPASVEASHPEQQDSQPCNSSDMSISSDGSHHELANENIPTTSNLERTSELPYELFPFLRGRPPSTVADPIVSWRQLSPYLQPIKQEHFGDDALRGCIFYRYFKNRQFIECSACNKTINLREDGLYHILGKSHFMQVTKRNEVFSMYMDLRRLCELLCEAKMEFMGRGGKMYLAMQTTQFLESIPRPSTLPRNTLPAEMPIMKTVETGKDSNEEPRIIEDLHREPYSSPFNNCPENDKIDFPFLRGRNHEGVLDLFVLSSTMRKKFDVICSEVNENPNIRTLARQIYFDNKVSYFCSYCQQNVNTFNLLLHSLSSTHLKTVLDAGQVFCKIKDYCRISRILHTLKEKLRDRPLSPHSLLPFGHGKPAESCNIFVSFQNIFDCLSALRITGRLDSEFYDFLLERYRDAADVNVCPHCGPLGLEKNVTNIPHFLSINHIAKAMEHGQVFVNDVKILQSQFRSYLKKIKSRAVGAILEAVEKAIVDKTYSNGSRDYVRMSLQILQASRMRQILP